MSASALTHNVFHDGRVQSIGFEHQGKRANAGAMAEGEYHFEIRTAERLMVLTGELLVRGTGTADYARYPAGSCCDLAAESSVDIKVEVPSAYLCEFL